METDKLTQLSEDLSTLAGLVERATKGLARIEKTLKEHERKIDEALQRSSYQEDDDDSCEGFGPKPECQPFNPNAETYIINII